MTHIVTLPPVVERMKGNGCRDSLLYAIRNSIRGYITKTANYGKNPYAKDTIAKFGLTYIPKGFYFLQNESIEFHIYIDKLSEERLGFLNAALQCLFPNPLKTSSFWELKKADAVDIRLSMREKFLVFPIHIVRTIQENTSVNNDLIISSVSSRLFHYVAGILKSGSRTGDINNLETLFSNIKEESPEVFVTTNFSQLYETSYLDPDDKSTELDKNYYFETFIGPSDYFHTKLTLRDYVNNLTRAKRFFNITPKDSASLSRHFLHFNY
jgi:hypothetical protein